MKRPLIHLDVHVTDHCNLNCKGCTHFAPLVEQEVFKDPDQVGKDLRELAKKFVIKKIHLLGGEPLLHPRVNEFVKNAREAFPRTSISVITNLLLVEQMPESFWNTLRQYNVKLEYSLYPPLIPRLKKIEDFLKNKDVKFDMLQSATSFQKRTNSKGDSSIEKAFKTCGRKVCVTLWNSRLYNCPMCYSVYYNKKFGNVFPEFEGYDIYKETGEEIFAKLGKPIEMCKYCAEEYVDFEWAQSPKSPDEW